jgi:type VII secretion protein EccB
MPGESPTKWQAQAYRFGVRRLESAVSDGDPLLRDDRRRRRLNLSLIISFVLAILVLGGFAVYGFISPAPKIGSSAVVIDDDTGGVYVSRDGVLYPAMNLSSALLAAGRGQSGNGAPSTTTVDTDTIGKQPRGPLLGIPGAPDTLPSDSKLVDSRWTVCDATAVDSARPPGSPPTVTTTAVLGEPKPAVGSLGTTGAMLVTADNGATTYLVWDGRRAKIDLGNPTIRLAFALDNNTKARPMSAAVLNLIPPSADIVVPPVPNAGEQRDWANALGVHVGDVFALERANGTRTEYVAWTDGVQPITPLIGDLIRDEFDVTKQVPLVSPIALRKAPRTPNPIDRTLYPAVPPDIVGADSYAVACVFRVGTSSSSTDVLALHAVPVPGQAKPVTVTKPNPLTVDDVYIHPGMGAVLSVATQSQPTGAGAFYIVTDEGVAYPVVNGQALGYLGLTKHVVATAPELVNLLPKGPTLDPDTAVHFYPQTGTSASGLPAPSSSSAGP